MRISAQVSVYPLRRERIGPAIDRFLRVLEEARLEWSTGAMSTLVRGEEDAVFDALRRGFAEAAAEGDVVMTVTFSNACPAGSGT